MGGKCCICGYNKCNEALACHHLDPLQKDLSFGSIRANPVSWINIVKELRKCILVCHNCHTEIHQNIVQVPNDAPRFDEKYADYVALQKIIKQEEKDKNSVLCHTCGAIIAGMYKYCSKSCSSQGSIKYKWENFDLEKLYKEIPVTHIAALIGCSDKAVHKQLEKMGLK